MSTQRSRANSAYSTEEGGGIFEEMNHEDDVVKKMSFRGNIHDMYQCSTHEGEKMRWLVAEVQEKSTCLNIVWRSLKKTALGSLGALLIFLANIFISSSPAATIMLKSLNIISYIKVKWKYSIKALKEILGDGGREGGRGHKGGCGGAANR